jgi:hypothetical protein
VRHLQQINAIKRRSTRAFMKLAADSLSCEGRSGVDGTTAETMDCVCGFGDRAYVKAWSWMFW